MLNKSSDEAKIAAGICPTCETNGRTMETAFDANCPAEWAHKFISKFARVSWPLAQQGAGSTGGAPTRDELAKIISKRMGGVLGITRELAFELADAIRVQWAASRVPSESPTRPASASSEEKP